MNSIRLTYVSLISVVVTWGLLESPRVFADESAATSQLVFTGPPMMLQADGAGEGPVWHPVLGLLTSGDGNINRRDLEGQVTIYREDSGSNGLLFDREGRLLVCDRKRRQISRIAAEGTLEVLVSSYEGSKFNQPNDLSIDSKNRIYFTDPQYGPRGTMEMRDTDGREIEGVYRIDADGTVIRILTHEVDRPNGLIVTPDDRYLFVGDNNSGVGGARKLWRFELDDEGTPEMTSQTLIHDWGRTRGPDGMKLDQAGRLYVAAGLNEPNLPQESAEQPTAGIYVFSPEGTQVGFAPIPRDETTNCAFGGEDGKTLFVTAGGTLWSIPTSVAGYQIR